MTSDTSALIARLAALRLTLIENAKKTNRKAPGAVIVDGAIFINDLDGNDPDWYAQLPTAEEARAVLVQAGWIQYGPSAIAFFPEARPAPKEPSPVDKSNSWQPKEYDWAAAIG